MKGRQKSVKHTGKYGNRLKYYYEQFKTGHKKCCFFLQKFVFFDPKMMTPVIHLDLMGTSKPVSRGWGSQDLRIRLYNLPKYRYTSEDLFLLIFLGEDPQSPTFKCSNNPLLPVAFKTTNVYSYEKTNHMLYCFFLAQVFWNSCLNIHKKYWYNLLLDKSFWKALCSQKTIFAGPPIW